MSYCDFNISLFKNFTSHKTKIEPKLSDDWELINKAYNTTDGIALQSKKLDTIIYDIPMRRFLTFCKMEKLHIIGNMLQGEFAVGQDRSVYCKRDFDKWTDKYTSRTENIISVKDAKVGHIYRTVCGLSVIYLGFKYTAKYKDNIEDKKYTKISKTHFIHTRVDFDDDDPRYGIQPKGSYKFIRDMGYALDSDEIKNVLKHHYYNNRNYVYFGDTLIKNPEYGYIEVQPFSYSYKAWQPDRKGQITENPYTILFSLVNGVYYKCRGGNDNYRDGTSYRKDLSKIKYHYIGYSTSSYRNEQYDIVPEKLMRIGVVN